MAITNPCAAGTGQPCDLVSLGAFDDRSERVGSEVTVERCRRCGVGVTRPPIADVAFLYADRSSIDFQPETKGLARLIKRIAFTAQARRMLKQAQFNGDRIIDFACGSGLFTWCMAQVSGSEVIGADFHDQPPPDLGKVPYRSMAALSELDGTADLVIAMHVVEHDDDPLKLVRRIAALGKPGATIVIEVPNVDCVWTPIFGRAWDAWYIPYHRIHFSRASLRATVQAAGLEIIRSIDVSVPTMGRSIANLLGTRNSTLFVLLSAVLQPLQWGLEKLTNRPSALRLILRKPG